MLAGVLMLVGALLLIASAGGIGGVRAGGANHAEVRTDQRRADVEARDRAGLLSFPGALPGGAALTPVGLWLMNESTSDTIAYDWSGHANNGRLNRVQLGVPGLSGSAYRFDGATSIVVVADAPSLNPGRQDFSFSMAVRFSAVPSTGHDFDLLRKGRSPTLGGEYKAEIVNEGGEARAKCSAKDSTGQVARTTLKTPNLADGHWHTIACQRRGSQWRLTVDGATAYSIAALGSIVNDASLTLGGKPEGATGHDWYPGDMDNVKVAIGQAQR